MNIKDINLQIETDAEGILLKTPDGFPVYVVGKVYSNTDLEVGYVANGDESKTLRYKEKKP